jgi:hypothetical protein
MIASATDLTDTVDMHGIVLAKRAAFTVHQTRDSTMMIGIDR